MATIVQGPPVADEVSTVGSGAFVSQLQVVSGFTGPVTFTQSTGGAALAVSSTGSITTTGSLSTGTYTATGTTADGSANTGTFTYTLTVVVSNSLGFPSYSIVGTPSGGAEAAITFNSNVPDVFGSYYFLDGDIAGWDSPDMRMSMLPKIGNDVNADGETVADLHYRGRSLQMTLFVECVSQVARENSKLLLAQAVNTTSCRFTANEVIPKWLSVVRAGNAGTGKLLMLDQGTTRKEAATQPPAGGQWGVPVGTYIYPFKATVEVYAADPYKYGVDLISVPFEGGMAAFTNPGTYPSMNGWIDIYVTGGGNGPLYVETPERIMTLIVPSVPAGAPALSPIPSHLWIDVYQQLIYNRDIGPDANYYYLRDMRTPWLRFPTGSSYVNVFQDLPGGVHFYPAWL